MDYAAGNFSNKIWVFRNEDWKGEIISDNHQQITIKFSHEVYQQHTVITSVYARYSALERLELWEDLEYIAESTTDPCIVGGDFNVIMEESEKLGGLPITQQEVMDFA